jgi:hypothetical protein
VAGGDMIDLSAIDANTLVDGDQAFVPIGDSFFRNPGELRFVSLPQGRLIEADVNGDGVADFAVLLNGTGALTAASFIL